MAAIPVDRLTAGNYKGVGGKPIGRRGWAHKMRCVQFSLLVALTVFVTGCANAPKIALSAKEVQSFKITAVDFAFVPDAMISWSDEEVAYAKSQGYIETGSTGVSPKPGTKSSYEDIINSPQSKEHQKKLLIARLKPAFDRVLAKGPSGTQPVRVAVAIKSMAGSPTTQCAVLGGGYNIEATAKIIDQKGQVVATQDRLFGIAVCASLLSGGVAGLVMNAAQGDKVDLMADSMATQFKQWLLPKPEDG